jgi:hypothetical protein
MPAGTRIYHPRTNRSRSSYRQERHDSSLALQSSPNSIFKSQRIGLINRIRVNSALDSGENVAAIIIVHHLATFSSLSLLFFPFFLVKAISSLRLQTSFFSRVILCSDHLLVLITVILLSITY